MQRQRETEETEKQKKVKNPLMQVSKQRLPTYAALLSLDHVIDAITGGGLQKFVVAAEDADKTLADRSVLVMQSDQGPDMNAAKEFALRHLELRLIFVPDIRHQLIREQENSCKLAKLSSTIALTDLLFTFLSGPWSECRWFQLVKEEADEYLSLTDPSPSSTSCTTLIRHLLPRIRTEKNWEPSADVEDVRAALASASFLRRKGTTNSSRWDSFHESFRSRKGEWGLLLLVLLSYGLRLGYVLNPKQATLSEDMSQVLPKAEEAASGQAEVAEKSLKQAKMKKDALYQRCRNKLHCCTVLLGSMEFCRDMTVWYLATEVLSAELNHVRKNIHGRNATRELMVGLACGTSPKVGLEVIAELVQVPHNAEGLRQLGVWLQDDIVGAVSVKQIARELQHPLVMWQDSIVQQLTDAILCACRFKLMNLSQHMFSFPLRFAALISEKQDDVNRCLKECVALSESWEAARHAAADSKGWNAVCGRSPMQTVVTREIFDALKASNFASVPPDVHRFLYDVMGMFSSTYNEEAFGEMRGLESRENKAHAMPNADIWQSASHSGVLSRFGYCEVAVDHSQEDPRLPEALYHTKGLAPTMENMKHVCKRQTWTSLAPHMQAMLPSELMMTKDLHTRKLLGQVAAAWRTNFLVRGLIIRQKTGSKDTFLSLGPWPKGCTTCMLPVCRWEVKKGVFAYSVRQPLTRESLHWATVLSFKDWEVAQVAIASPLHFGIASAGATKTTALTIPPLSAVPWLETAKAFVPLLQHLARHAFYDVEPGILEILYQD